MRASSLYQTLGDTDGAARSLVGLGDLALASGAPAEARGAFEQAIQVLHAAAVPAAGAGDRPS